jgi:hypothetical protein
MGQQAEISKLQHLKDQVVSLLVVRNKLTV